MWLGRMSYHAQYVIISEVLSEILYKKNCGFIITDDLNNNKPEKTVETRLRRLKHNLVIDGTAILAFGIWSVIKSIIYLITEPAAEPAIVPEVIPDVYELVMIFLTVIVMIIMIIDLAMRVFVGLSARSEGKGKKRRYVYLGFTVILILLSILSIYENIRTISSRSVPDVVAAIIVELTALYFMLDLFISGIRVKTLEKKIKLTDGGRTEQ